MALLLLVPLLVVATLSMACDPQMFKYGENFRATEEFVAAQATEYARSVRATATTEAPAVRTNATAIVETALAAAPEDVRSLYDRFGMVLVQIPAGDYLRGEDLPNLEKRAEFVHVDEYWMSLTEVTNGQYAAFVDAGGYVDVSLWTEEGWRWLNEQTYAGPICAGNEDFNAPDQPLTCVNLYEAQAYATWLSRESGLSLRLPSVDEWEMAARGADGRRYPWGDEEPRAELTNYAAGLGRTIAVGSKPEGASAYGLLDMAGNVAEWTSTQSDFDEQYTVRGGSWFDYASALVPSHNRYYAPEHQQNTIGFRLVADVE